VDDAFETSSCRAIAAEPVAFAEDCAGALADTRPTAASPATNNLISNALTQLREQRNFFVPNKPRDGNYFILAGTFWMVSPLTREGRLETVPS
jgi:hypothetical protein